MNTREEIKEILTGLKSAISIHSEIGFEMMPISSATLKYLDNQKSWRHVEAHEGQQPETLEALREYIGDCQRCKLHKGRKQIVFGDGNPKARLVFIGEGPGRDEDRVGKPFVGEAGRLLTKIITAMGLTREEVYICNVIKCRPPQNRDPEKDELEACIPFLRKQLELIEPEVICTLGRVASQNVLGSNFKITEERGKWRSYMDIPLMPTFHPAYLLRYPAEKRPVWEDVQEIMKKLGLEVKKGA